MIIPKKLKIGDIIGIFSPASPFVSKEPDFTKGIKVLEQMGFKVKFSEYARGDLNGWGIAAGTPEQKVNDLHKFLVDDEVKMIMCSIGGKTANSILDLIDYKLIKRHPKIICGFSDITSILNAIYKKTGLITFSGPDIWSHLVPDSNSYTKAEFLARYTEVYTGEVRKNSLWEEVRPGTAKGRLLGGTIAPLIHVLGQGYMPKLKNNILILESYSSENLRAIAATLYHFKNLGVWGQISGLVVGYNHGNEKDGMPKISVEDLILEITKEYDFPILKVRDIGHRTECTPIPIGAKAKMDTSKLSLKIIDKYLK